MTDLAQETNDPTIFPVVMCGGSGTRLWPLSRKESPKQFQSMTGGESLFIQTIRRFAGDGFGRPLVLVGRDLLGLAQSQSKTMMNGSGNAPYFVVEPFGRNTAPAIAAAAAHASADGEDPLLLVTPSDHLVEDATAFRDAVAASIAAADAGKIVTFGVSPRGPHTGYGYIHAKRANGAGGPRPVAQFIEKPDLEAAEKLIADGDVYWNAGVFLFRASTILRELELYAKDVGSAAAAAVKDGAVNGVRIDLSETAFAQAPDISIDFAVMEASDNVVVQPVEAAWSDVGGWSAMFDLGAKDAEGNVVAGDAEMVDSHSCLVRGDGGRLISVVGLDDVVVVDTPDAVLVSARGASESVRQVADRLRESGRREATTPKCVHRPWGNYEGIAEGPGFQVKRIVVKPGEILSLQYHHHRSEHWTVVQGTAEVTVDEKVERLSENQSVYIPLGAVHRLANPGKIDMHLIEVQCGSYLGEDDIVRIEDNYGRVA